MTAEKLIEAMMEECRATRTRVEDFLRAFGDVVSAKLQEGETVPVAGFGRFGLRPYVEQAHRHRKAFNVTFWADHEVRKRLRLVDPPPAEAEPCPSCKSKNPGLCQTCKTRKRHTAVYRDCKSCMQSRTRINRERAARAVQGSRVQKFKVVRRDHAGTKNP